MNLFWTQGLPGCGKTSVAMNMMGFPNSNLKRVNRDDLRSMVDDSKWSRQREKTIVKLRDLMILTLLYDGYNVISDDTNFSKSSIEALEDLANKASATLIKIDMTDMPVEKCIEQDLKRQNSVGKDVILRMYYQYLCKDKPTYDAALHPCYIFDMDGTLAEMHERGPYEFEKCGNDLLRRHVSCVLRYTESDPLIKIFIFSGREGRRDIYEITEKWLMKHGIDFDLLVLRQEGDRRNDALIKKEMYNDHVLGKYNVVGVFDDRPGVIRMWRQLGLPVFDCGNGVEF
jgi:predicted kinase